MAAERDARRFEGISFFQNHLSLHLKALTEAVLPHRLQGIGFRGWQVNEDRPDRRRGHLALKANECKFQKATYSTNVLNVTTSLAR